LFDLIEDFKQKSGYGVAKISAEPEKNNLNTSDLRTLMGALRGIKTKEELDLLRKAVDISCIGQIEVMKAIKPGMSEREIQGIHEFVFRKYGSEYQGYPSIVGSGHNGCILHYIDNHKPEISSKDMILMDLGAEYRGYTADVTRTIPINGKFSAEQKAIYDLVLKAQEAAMKQCVAGTPWRKPLATARKIINQGLFELGIIKSANEAHGYFPHGISHHIGLDVHDKGNTSRFEPNMVITVEPGVYIPEGADCNKKWWGIAVRIEDCVLIRERGEPELLSYRAPRNSEAIEEMMKQSSILDQFKLPDLDK
ncbi:MAG: M24B family metallopeptidase, partial [Bacteroidota bacterium]